MDPLFNLLHYVGFVLVNGHIIHFIKIIIIFFVQILYKYLNNWYFRIFFLIREIVKRYVYLCARVRAIKDNCFFSPYYVK